MRSPVLLTLVLALGGTSVACSPRPASPGESVFRSAELRCGNCHRVGGKGGQKGPPLDKIGAKRDREWLRASIRDMSLREPGTNMPPFPAEKLPDKDLDILVDWLVTLK